MTEKNVKTVFLYDEDGFFEAQSLAMRNPKSLDSWLMPPRSTTVKPELLENFFYQIKNSGSDDSDWVAVPYPATKEDFLALEVPHQSRTKRNHKLRELLRDFVKNHPDLFREKQINDEKGNLIAITVEEIPQPTEEELKEQAAASARAKRDYLLSQTDYLLQPDYPISGDELEQVKSYRQDLRDLPEQEGFPDSINWPNLPSFLVK